uniref:Large ribosomal subunit protein uL13c n=1 Tax=Roundia cardiophora TaxID=1403802 RepID=A0A089X8C2_9STRA|nr:ribosomal protein L13 [Roundia cardiophora]AIR75924.1 ribosomal protein L13 [Roundia cardiophora]
MNKTFIPASNYNKRKWYLIDCKDKQLGRLASTIIPLLTGKSKPIYHPSVDIGDYVILINTEYLKLDNNAERFHVFKPGHPGSSLKRLVNILPKQIIENCVFGMLPNGFPKKHLVKRLKVYQGAQHPHLAQNPKELNII